MALIAWLLTGLLTAPAMAFGMMCHGGMDQTAVASDMPMTMHMAHSSMPHSDKNMEHKAFSCAVHCLSAGAGFVLSSSSGVQAYGDALTLTGFRATSLDGLSLGPPLEPPIAALV